PLVAVVTGSTARTLRNPGFRSIPLFQHLLPSLLPTMDCGFEYVVVVGYDVGDPYYDKKSTLQQVNAWFEEKVAGPALARRNISVALDMLRVDNKLRKPGPVFLAAAAKAYAHGAEYLYRVNDDTEFRTPWAAKFVGALQRLGPPYGVVGPASENKKILVHDFTHRLHMDIFRGEYYPAELTDWWLDDWISCVYGRKRTIRAKNVEV
ncbi:unnamed protein product, partial [Phaeothamnion confervicola]